MIRLIIIFFSLTLFSIGSGSCFAADSTEAQEGSACQKGDYLTSISVSQTSADYLYEYMVLRYEGNCFDEQDRKIEEGRLALVSDIYIKAWSYAWLNKLFFVISIFFAIVVLTWPALAVIAPTRLGQSPIFKSAVVQTTVTAIAAASFFTYSDYKGKQMSAENLMRYVIHTQDDMSLVSRTVIDELARIDQGFSFSKALQGGES